MEEQKKNIWTDFKNELGYVNASAQYIELVCRIAVAEHGHELHGSNLSVEAKKYGLSVSVLPEDIESRIASNYIIQIHSCIEAFLNNFQNLTGSPVNNINENDVYNPNKENRLHWVMRHSIPVQTDRDKELYYICDYYRLLRNVIIHKGKITTDYKAAYSKVKNMDTGRLNALNGLEKICFDDQVLFSRAAHDLLERIFKDSKYDWDLILKSEEERIKEFTKSYDNNPDRINKHINNYLRRYYPIPEDGISFTIERKK